MKYEDFPQEVQDKLFRLCDKRGKPTEFVGLMTDTGGLEPTFYDLDMPNAESVIISQYNYYWNKSVWEAKQKAFREDIEQMSLRRATKFERKDYTGPVFYDGRVYGSIAEFETWAYRALSYVSIPSVVYVAKAAFEDTDSLNADVIISTLYTDGLIYKTEKDNIDSLSIKKLQEALDLFRSTNKLIPYVPDYERVVILK